jgi:inner membrane protein
MDTLAHSLVGLAASKAGLERLSPGATAVCILAANAPDIDFVAAISGDRWTVLHYHRGITHSIVGTLLLGIIIPTLFCLVERLLRKWQNRPLRFRFSGLCVAGIITAATHPLLDWTNNYGVRPLLPWSGRWFYGDIVFVVDPVIWVLIGAGAFLLTSDSRSKLALWGLLGAVLTLLVVYATVVGRATEHPILMLIFWFTALIAIVTASRSDVARRFGSKLALSALGLLLVYWGVLGFVHNRALSAAQKNMVEISTQNHEQLLRLAAMPTLANPGRWRCVAETDRATYSFDIYLPGEPPVNLVRFEKPNQSQTDIVVQAQKDRRAQAFFEFARFPVMRIVNEDCVSQTLVQFADLRYTEPGKTRGSFALDVPVECPGNVLAPSNGR